MGKKGNWFSAIKKVFSPNSKDKVANELEKNSIIKKKKWGLGKLRNGEKTFFIPLCREPSSIEKILGDAEKERQMAQPILSSTDQRRVQSAPSIVVQHYEQINQSNNKNKGSGSSSTSNTNTITTPNSTTSNTATPRKPYNNSSSNNTPTKNTATTRTKNANGSSTTTTNTATPRTDNNSSSSKTNTTTTKNYRIPPTIEQHHIAATKIQTIYRGYMARRSFRALKGLMRLQGVVRGQSVKRQTMNAMKYMQLLVKVQTQIRSRRIHTLENQAQHHSGVNNSDKELENNMARWILTQTAERGQENWDDSVLTKEELDARLQRKVDAIIKRERALAYVHSHQSLKASPESALMDIRSGGFPWWRNWTERQLPDNHSEIQSTQLKNDRFSEIQSTQTKDGQLSEFQSRQLRNDMTPPRRWSQGNSSATTRPQTGNSKQQSFRLENLDSLTPRPKSHLGSMARTPVHLSSSRSPLPNKPGIPMKHPKPRSVMGGEYPLRDNDSLTSCPPFSVPNYMTPTVSAQAKVRSHSNPKDRLLATPDREQKRRLSFPLTQSIGSMTWGKSPLFSSKDSSSRSVLGKNQHVHSVGNVSVDSTVSLTAHLGRRPFK